MAERTTTLKKKPFLLPGALAAALLLVVFIGFMIEGRAQILRDGQEVALKTAPIDPRDLLRGRYVRLNYAASSIDVDDILPWLDDDERRVSRDRTVYVTFESDAEGFDVPTDVVLKRPSGGKYIRASVTGGQVFFNGDVIGGGRLRVDFGVDRFYTNEQLAPELEERMRDGEITTVVVAVDEAGTAQIKAFRQDGINIVTERIY